MTVPTPAHLLLAACVITALAAAHRLASRLTLRAPLHTLALTIVFFVVNLILPVTYAGLVGQLNPAGMLVAGLLVWGVGGWLAGQVRPFQALTMTHDTLPAWITIGWRGVWLAVGLVAAAQILTTIVGQGPVYNTDAIWHYIPNLVHLVQSGTLHAMEGIAPYFPAAYEILFAWEAAFVQTLFTIPFLHGLMFVGSLFYALLITSFLLREQSTRWCMAAMLVAALLMITARLPQSILQETGKNDQLILLAGLASAYYLLLYWQHRPQPAYLTLVGLMSGLYVSTKLTGVVWVAALGLIHLVMMLRAHSLKLHGILPFVLMIAPWLLRIAINPQGLMTSGAQASAAAGSTVIQHLGNLNFYIEFALWLPGTALLVLGAALLLFARQPLARPAAALSGLVSLIGLVLLALSPAFDTNFGALFATLLVCIVILVRARAAALSAATIFTTAVVLLTLLGFIITPYAVWYDVYTWLDNLAFYAIQYRFSAATHVLFGILIIALAVQSLRSQPQPSVPPVPANAAHHMPMRGQMHGEAWGIRIGLVLIALIVSAPLLLGHNVFRQAAYPSFLGRHPNPLPAYTWINDNLRDASIYAINAPPLLLYGQRLSNWVLYVPPGYGGYFGDQPYRWIDIEPLIETRHLDYIVVTFSFPEFPQARLLPDDAVLAEIDQMRARLNVVYEDAMFVIFATQSAAG